MQHVPDELVNGKLFPPFPVIMISTSSDMATGKVITHFPTDFYKLGPIVGVTILDVLVILRTAGML